MTSHTSCGACCTTYEHGQRYCLSCGARLGDHLQRLAAAGHAPSPAPVTATQRRRAFRPLTAALLAAGVSVGALVGSLSNPSANVAAAPPNGLSIAMAAPSPTPPAALSEGPPTEVPPVVDETPATPEPTDPAPGTSEDESPPADPAPQDETSTADDTTATDDTGSGDTTTTQTDTGSNTDTTTADPGTASTTTAKLPAIGHVWLVMLADAPYDDLFGTGSAATFLNGTLRTQGVLLSQFHGTSHGGLTSAIATISGQGPTPELQGGCPSYADIAPGSVDVSTGQAKGAGCVFPAKVSTLASQLKANGLSWRAYVTGQGAPGDAGASCRHPQPGSADPTAGIPGADGYRTARNPFMYFHGVIDDPDCTKNDVGLDQLGVDLTAAAIPDVSYIAPDPVTPAAGVPGADAWLQQWVPQIQATEAYKKDGLIIIMSGAAGPADTSGCCDALDLPNITDDAKGGGRTGALVLSPFADHGRTDTTPADHYSVLRTIEDVLNLPYLGFAKQRDPLTTALTPASDTTTTK
jgi:hypothetical protein